MLFNILTTDGIDALHNERVYSLCNGETMICLRTHSGILSKTPPTFKQ